LARLYLHADAMAVPPLDIITMLERDGALGSPDESALADPRRWR